MKTSQGAARKGVVTFKETVGPRLCQKFTSLEYPCHLKVLLDLPFDMSLNMKTRVHIML